MHSIKRWFVVVSVLSLGFFLVGCTTPTIVPTATPTIVPIATPTATSSATLNVPSSQFALLMIEGIDDNELPAMLYIDMRATVFSVFTEAVKTTIDEVFAQTDYLELALLSNAQGDWQLYFTDLLTSTIIPRSAHIELGTFFESYSSQIFKIQSVVPINETRTPVKFDEGIQLINSTLNETVPSGKVFSRDCAFLLLSDGRKEQSRYKLIVFEPVKLVKSPPLPFPPSFPLNPPAWIDDWKADCRKKTEMGLFCMIILSQD